MTDQETLIYEITVAVAPFSDPELAKRNLLERMAACEIQPETPEALAWLRMMKRQTTASLAGCVPV